MISRIWHGYTTPGNADTYENLLKEEIFVGIRDRNIPGFHEIQLFRRELGDEVEFITVMWFELVGCRPPVCRRRLRTGRCPAQSAPGPQALRSPLAAL